MSTAKLDIINKINNMPDDMDEMQLIEQLYKLSRLSHSVERCEKEGTLSDEQVSRHFVDKSNRYNLFLNESIYVDMEDMDNTG